MAQRYKFSIESKRLPPSLSGEPCSNCTFMELKYNISDANLAAIVSSNCTFMELKSRCCVTQSAVSQF